MYLQELEIIPEKLKKFGTNAKKQEIALTFKDAPNCLYLGRGYNFRLL
jgi:glucosamine--fructose-6-phosphate aminotransferase (isomerizing)